MTANASSSASGGQLKLRFPTPDDASAPLITDGAYKPVWLALSRWEHWPEGQMALVGDVASGKTRLMMAWADRAGAAIVTGAELSRADISQIDGMSVSALAIDDADKCTSGEALLAAINLCRQRRAPLLICGQAEPSTWGLEPQDLTSRLRAYPVVRIGQADDEALKARITAACKARYMRLPGETADYLIERMNRAYAQIDTISAALERVAEGKALSKPVARRALDEIRQD